MATFNICNQFDQKTDGMTVLSGTVHTEYEDLPQPKPAEQENESFSAKSLFGKALGGLVAVACAAAVVGVAAAYVASVVVTGGASLAAAPLLVTGTAFLLTSGFAAYSGSQVLEAQYQMDLANEEDSGWGAYVGAPAMETVKTGARDLTWQIAIPVAGKAASPVINKYGSQLFGKMFRAKVPNVSGNVPENLPQANVPTTKAVNPNQINFSQRSAGGGGRYAPLKESMQSNGWNGNPIDAVQTPKGITTIDNTRVAVARELHIESIPVRIHAPTELLPSEMIGRFGNSKTWGDALRYRTGRQRPPLTEYGTPEIPRLPK